MSDHDDWVANGFCEAIYVDEDEDEHWCRLPAEADGKHHDTEGTELPHVAPWEYNFPKQETMVRWLDGPTAVKFVIWKPDPPTTPASLF